MAVTVTVTEVQGNDVTITDNKTVITTNNVVQSTAADIIIAPITGSDITATNIQDAIHQLADQKFTGTSAPASGDANLDEGDLWYDTVNNLLKVYRNTTWEDLVISAQLSESSGTTEYTDINLNGGYF